MRLTPHNSQLHLKAPKGSAFGVPEEIITTTNAAKYDVMSGAAELH
jgi:hypothetical protein